MELLFVEERWYHWRRLYKELLMHQTWSASSSYSVVVVFVVYCCGRFHKQ